MAKRLALTRRAQYLAVYSAGTAVANDVMVVKALPNGLEATRVGFSVTKAIGNAVIRNRAKRLLKENARLLDIKSGWDIVVIARRNIVSADFHDIRSSMVRLLRRSNLLMDNAAKMGAQVN